MRYAAQAERGNRSGALQCQTRFVGQRVQMREGAIPVYPYQVDGSPCGVGKPDRTVDNNGAQAAQRVRGEYVQACRGADAQVARDV